MEWVFADVPIDKSENGIKRQHPFHHGFGTATTDRDGHLEYQEVWETVDLDARASTRLGNSSTVM